MKGSLSFLSVVALAVAGAIAPEPARDEPDDWSAEAAMISGLRLPRRHLRLQRVVVTGRPQKVAQLIGDWDRERQQPTANLTYTRYRLYGTDLGVSFQHKGVTYLAFGDTVGIVGEDRDALALSTDTNPENGLGLQFFHDMFGSYQPVTVPGIAQGAFEVPMEGTSAGGRLYLYLTTNRTIGANGLVHMGRSVVAVSEDDGRSFSFLYDLSTRHFINVSLVEVDSAAWQGLPAAAGPGLVIFGSGDYRRSNVRLAFQPADAIGTPASLLFYSGASGEGSPLWSAREDDAVELFQQPCVGELSVSYNRFIRSWIMLYNCGSVILLRTAPAPWGPWSAPQVLFDPRTDGGFCQFIHVSWLSLSCDNVQDPGRENESGGVYGPYQLAELAAGDGRSTTIYFTMSTWNPYTVVLMKATLQLAGTIQ